MEQTSVQHKPADSCSQPTVNHHNCNRDISAKPDNRSQTLHLRLARVVRKHARSHELQRLPSAGPAGSSAARIDMIIHESLTCIIAYTHSIAQL